MNHHDAIVVGAGPAGSTCAGQLKKAGFNVKLFDKAVFPRVKPCAGWITPQIIEALQLDIGDYRQHNTLQPITGFLTGVIGGRTVVTRFDEPVSFGIRRVEFDDYLLRRTGVPCDYLAVRTITREKGLWKINGQFTAPLLIGAGGHFCPVARWMRTLQANNQNRYSAGPSAADEDKQVLIFAQEIEFPAFETDKEENGVDPFLPELYFCRDMKGYGWCFRKGNFLNVGLGRFDKEGLREHVQSFCRFLQQSGKLQEDLPDRFQGHVYRLYAVSPPLLCDDGILLIGDSAGLAYPNSGEGIRPAIESAIIAADVISRANGDYSLEELGKYRSGIFGRLGKPASYAVSGWIPAAWLQGIAARLMANRWFARNIVIDNWFLHRHQKSLHVPGIPCKVEA